MKKTIDANEMKKAFEDFGRDYYSQEGYEALLDFYNYMDENTELDVIAICCEWTEYTDEELIAEYGDDERYADSDLSEIIADLRDQTYVIELSESVLLAAF